jgi:hypothetical protein
MTQTPSAALRMLPLLVAAAALGLGATACEQAPLEPSPSALIPVSESSVFKGMTGSYTETVYLQPVMDGVYGTSTLQRRTDGFNFRITAYGLPHRHPVTLWAINVETGDVGFAASGIVGGSGKVNLAGNHCVWEEGKSPGTSPNCDLIYPMGGIHFVMLVGEDRWVPGDMMVRRYPAGKPTAAMAEHHHPGS